jgi:hypothetical protein
VWPALEQTVRGQHKTKRGGRARVGGGAKRRRARVSEVGGEKWKPGEAVGAAEAAEEVGDASSGVIG